MNPLAQTALALPFPTIDPVIFSIGPLAIHWYGVAYVVGILLGWWFAKRVVTSPKLWPDGKSPISAIELDDFLTWAVIGIIAGGRLGYVIFYNFSYYLSNPLLIPAVWDGGMSFHGGALGLLVAMLLFARRRGFSVFSLFDVVTIASCFGLFFGRIANFINSELWGRTTDVSWAFVFPNGGPVPRHPSQLYEAGLEGLALFCILTLLIFKLLKLHTPGFVAGMWVLGYGVSRIIVEFFRQPDEHIGYLADGWLTMGMVLSVPMLAIGLWGMWSSKSRTPWRTTPMENQDQAEA